jgi:glutamine synthetase adenylyltransferase
VPLKSETSLETELRQSQEALRGVSAICQLNTLTQDEKLALVLRRVAEALLFRDRDVLGSGGL